MNGTIGKICKNPECPEKGKKQPYENFSKGNGYADGLMAECKKCLARRTKSNSKKKKEERERFFKLFI